MTHRSAYLSRVLPLLIFHSGANRTILPPWGKPARSCANRSEGSFNIRMYALGIVEHSRRQRGDTDGLRQMIHQSLPDERAVLKMCLAQALIEQGQVEAGLRELVEIGKCYDYIMAQIAVSLHRHGSAEDARRIVDALRVGLFQRGFPHRRPTNRASEMMRLSTPYGEVRVPSNHRTTPFGGWRGRMRNGGFSVRRNACWMPCRPSIVPCCAWYVARPS